ncbi:hypothetical protein MmTuc01_0819 [Methanosarcina mazei Tuc01]|uniref:Uncharacterized protein n=1 Tax=Methanosarcina mazei Tuc01 TaxID=1236903 RepID=M1Q1R7_METMZ|nr:hypothetical protein MmTuc01_0819 [Methanosarcina mazei Tuc01]
MPNNTIMKPINVTVAPTLRKSSDARMWNDIVLLLLNLSFKFFISVENFALLFQNYTSFETE